MTLKVLGVPIPGARAHYTLGTPDAFADENPISLPWVVDTDNSGGAFSIHEADAQFIDFAEAGIYAITVTLSSHPDSGLGSDVGQLLLNLWVRGDIQPSAHPTIPFQHLAAGESDPSNTVSATLVAYIPASTEMVNVTATQFSGFTATMDSADMFIQKIG